MRGQSRYRVRFVKMCVCVEVNEMKPVLDATKGKLIAAVILSSGGD